MPILQNWLFLPGEFSTHFSQRREDEIEDKYANTGKKKNDIVVHSDSSVNNNYRINNRKKSNFNNCFKLFFSRLKCPSATFIRLTP